MKTGALQGVLVAVGLTVSVAAWAQSSAVSSPVKATFDVAAIKPSGPEEPPFHGSQFSPSGRFTAKDVSIVDLMCQAYKLPGRWTVTGEPGWVDSKLFDVEASVDPEVAERLNKLAPMERRAVQMEMLQGLLADRFKLKVHREMKEQGVYAMVVAKGGAKLPVSPDKPLEEQETGGLAARNPAAASQPMTMMMADRWRALRMTMDSWAEMLEGQPEIQRTILNETGLTGKYEFELKWSRTPDDAGPGLFAAMEDQLGLKLVAKKAPAEVIVVESVAMPTQN